MEFPEKKNFSLIDEAHQPTVVIVHLFFFLPENGWNFPRNVLFLVFAQNFPETAFLFFCCLYFLQSALSFFLFVRISFKLQYQWGSMGAAGGISLKQHFLFLFVSPQTAISLGQHGDSRGNFPETAFWVFVY